MTNFVAHETSFCVFVAFVCIEGVLKGVCRHSRYLIVAIFLVMPHSPYQFVCIGPHHSYHMPGLCKASKAWNNLQKQCEAMVKDGGLGLDNDKLGTFRQALVDARPIVLRDIEGAPALLEQTAKACLEYMQASIVETGRKNALYNAEFDSQFDVIENVVSLSLAANSDKPVGGFGEVCNGSVDMGATVPQEMGIVTCMRDFMALARAVVNESVLGSTLEAKIAHKDFLHMEKVFRGALEKSRKTFAAVSDVLDRKFVEFVDKELGKAESELTNATAMILKNKTMEVEKAYDSLAAYHKPWVGDLTAASTFAAVRKQIETTIAPTVKPKDLQQFIDAVAKAMAQTDLLMKLNSAVAESSKLLFACLHVVGMVHVCKGQGHH